MESKLFYIDYDETKPEKIHEDIKRLKEYVLIRRYTIYETSENRYSVEIQTIEGVELNDMINYIEQSCKYYDRQYIEACKTMSTNMMRISDKEGKKVKPLVTKSMFVGD